MPLTAKMSSSRAQHNGNIGSYNELENQSVFVYKPARATRPADKKPPKRRKLAHAHESHAQNGSIPFTPLLDGKENVSLVNHRYATFKSIWASQDEIIQRIIHDVDSKVVGDLSEFIKETSPDTYEGRVSCGMITLGSQISSISGLLYRLCMRIQADGVAQMAVLEACDASNIKNALKTLNRLILADLQDDSYHGPCALGPKPLPYDLALLHAYVQRHPGQKIVVAFKDSEAFDNSILSDLISLLWCWRDRIPFVFIFGVATSVELFESRLPRSTVSLLQGRCFDIREAADPIDRIFIELETRENFTLSLGHFVSALLLKRAKEHFHSPERFSRSLKYCIMSHFFANPLAALLATEVRENDFQPELCEAIRNLPSFRRYAETLLNEKKPKLVQSLLDEDRTLAREVLEHVKKGQESMNSLFKCVESLRNVVQFLTGIKAPNMSAMVVDALGGKLYGSKLVAETLSGIQRIDSNSFKKLLVSLSVNCSSADQLLDELQLLLDQHEGSEPLKTKYDHSRVTHKTTIVAQRMRLTKGRVNLSKEETEYTRIVDRFQADFRTYLTDNLIQPVGLFMHEAFLFDFMSPIRDTITPRPRFAMERALSNPSAYLDFDTRSAIEFMSASQPATTLIHQLYLESGALVNIYDLWRAFYTIFGGIDGEDYEERAALSLFYRAISELKMMGMVKPSRRKTDHLAKLSWSGL